MAGGGSHIAPGIGHGVQDVAIPVLDDSNGGVHRGAILGTGGSHRHLSLYSDGCGDTAQDDTAIGALHISHSGIGIAAGGPVHGHQAEGVGAVGHQVVIVSLVIGLVIDLFLLGLQDRLILLLTEHLHGGLHQFLLLGSLGDAHLHRLLADGGTDGLLIEVLTQTGHDLSIDGVMELGRDLGLVVVEDDIVNIIVTLMLAGVLGDHGLLALFLAGVHDVGHIEGVDMGQPVIDHQQLLGHGLGAGSLHQRQDLVPGSGDGTAIEVHAQHVAVGEVLDHTDQVVILVCAGTDSLHGHVGQSQHLTQDAQTVLALIVVGQEEGHLDAQHVGVGGPVVQILLVQVQHGADLLGAQGHLLTVIVQDHHGLQLFLHQDDGRITVVDRALIHLDVAGQVDLQGLGVEDHFVRDDELVVRLLLGAGLCAALVSGAGLAGHGSLCLGGRGHGRHSEHADHHGQDQQQAEETLGHILHCLYLPF